MVAVFGGDGESTTARLARCTMGFVVAVVWIMAIADEVVKVLQVRTTFPPFFSLQPDSLLSPLAHIAHVDFRVHLWAVRCYHWAHHLRRWKLVGRPGRQYERSGTRPFLVTTD